MIRGTLHRQTIHLRLLLAALQADFVSMRERGVIFEALAFVDELVADSSLLRRLLSSLVHHAMRRAPDGSLVTLVASPRRGCVEFRIADEGPRLAASTREKVFGPENAGPQERGFHLTYCRLVTEALGGNFWIGDTEAGGVVCLALPTTAAASRPGLPDMMASTQHRVG